ncbi:MAG TPA: hypothetical protein VNZ52_06455, partial [Candidatus Thermoplasmatota archaeon]|nr:hypothetical protein [Candidatus Thermoplasmatota archaeon]
VIPPFTLRLEEGRGPFTLEANGTLTLTLLVGPNATHANRTLRFSWSLREAATNESVEATATGVRVTFSPTAPTLNRTRETEVTMTLTGRNATAGTYTLEVEAATRGEGPRLQNRLTIPVTIRA